MTRVPFRPATSRLLAIAACALMLSGCISLLPKSPPAHLYRFGPNPTAMRAQPTGTKPVAVFRTNCTFQGEAAGDRMLTISDGKAAYIGQSRWVAPADVLFDEAVGAAFDASPIRLLARGQQGRSAYALRLDVRSFETRYTSGSKAAPVVVVRVHAALNRDDQSIVGEQIFEAEVPAADNRVGPIVSAYNQAVGQVLDKIVAWTEAKAT